MKNKLLNCGLLYIILDVKTVKKSGKDIFTLTDCLAHYGADIFQLRAKNIPDNDFLNLAEKLSKIIHRRRKIFIVNDRADIAYLSKADGLHLGKNDISCAQARKILGKKAIIGKTVHSIKELNSFQNESINYISIGPAFKTKTKPELAPLNPKKLKVIANKSAKLTFAIGGINLYNIHLLRNFGINNIAVCRAIILSKNPKAIIAEYKRCLKKAF